MEGDDYDEVFAERTLGYGGMVTQNGVGVPMSDDEALLIAIPTWLASVADLRAIVHLCLRAASRTNPSVRVAALEAFAVLASRTDALPNYQRIAGLTEAALIDSDEKVRAAAKKALSALSRHNG